MSKQFRKVLPTAMVFTAGVVSASLLGPALATSALAAPATSSHVQQASQANQNVVAKVLSASDAQYRVAALATSRTMSARAAEYAQPGGPSTKQDVKIGNTKGRIWYKKISDRKLFVEGADTGWIARYDVQVRRADGKVVFDKNLSVYKLAWFVNNFKASASYANEADLKAALKGASNLTEAEARAKFKARVGELGKMKTPSGALQTPYDPAQHPGHPYIPLDYVGG